MRHSLIAALVAVSSTAAVAQGGNVLFSNIDIPMAHEIINRDSFTVHGWAFNCNRGGQQPHSVVVRLFTASSFTVVPVTMTRTIYRPDVKAAFATICGEMSSYTGFALVPVDANSLPTGTFNLVVEWSDSYGATYSQRTITLQ